MQNNWKIEKDTRTSYLVYSTPFDLIEGELKMLNKNDIETIMNLKVVVKDGINYIYFDIGRIERFEEVIKDRFITKDDLIKYINQIISVIYDIERHMLNIKNLVIDIDKVYIDKDINLLMFPYIPTTTYINQTEGLYHIKSFINLLINKVDKKNADTMIFIKDLLAYVNDESFNIIDLKELINNKRLMEEASGYKRVKVKDIRYNYKKALWIGIAINIFLILFARVFLDANRIFLMVNLAILMGISIWLMLDKDNTDDGEYTLHDIDSTYCSLYETVVLEKAAYIKPINSGEKIFINKGVFKIGKLEECDLKLNDINTISRMHAVILKDGSSYKIKDAGSTNGTYLNNELLEKDKSYALSTNDLLSFAGEVYIFKE